MFVERMEILGYRQKFEIEPSTFSDSTNTAAYFLTLLTLKRHKKTVFSLKCVCGSVYEKKFVSGYERRKLTDLNEKFGVCCNGPRIENLP